MVDQNEENDKFQDLLTVVIDSRNGYREALDDTKLANMAAFFASMLELKDRHVIGLEGLLRQRGQVPDESGSFLTTINRAIFSIRSVFGGVDENVLPGLIDGETRIISYYDDAIVVAIERDHEKDELTKQRLELTQMIDTMRAMQTKSS